MKVKLRDGKLHICGYVNVPGRESRPVSTPLGKVIEIIEQRAFRRAIEKAKEIKLLVDHDENKILATTADKSLKVAEDNVGLRAEFLTDDTEVIEAAKTGRLKGWSFGMSKVIDEIENRADKLPIRRIKDMDMSEISLIIKAHPYYSSTSIELRSGAEEEMEYRSCMEVDISIAPEKESIDNSSYVERVKKLKGEE